MYTIINWLKKDSKILYLSLSIGFIMTVIISYYTNLYANEIVDGISKEVIRFHVRANSNEEYDQVLKLKVKNAVINSLEKELKTSNSLEETRSLIKHNINKIEAVANKTILDNGYNYSVNIYLTKEFFPTKVYGNAYLPTGIYEALRIDIGEKNGENWWCVMYPPLCFVDISATEIPIADNIKLKKILNTEEYNLVFMQENDDIVPIQVKFKIVEWWQNQKNNNTSKNYLKNKQ